jgi:hypothetical protein
MNNEIHFFRAGKLEVVDKDLSPGPFDWYTTEELINLFDPEGRWRLPTIMDLKYLYQLHLMGIGGFKKNYWSSTSINGPNTEDAMWVMDFSDGIPYHVGIGSLDLYMTHTNRARLVRDIL